MIRKASLLLYALALAGVLAWQKEDIDASHRSAGTPILMSLTRGPYVVLDFPPRERPARAVILFGSGDGGWSSFEESICLTLRQQGYEPIGIDANAYAATDYDLATLQADYGRIARRATAFQNPPPVIIGGWSMGAAQAIAAAGGPHPPRGLVGLLLLDPCSRGRYGLRLSDRIDLLPTGPGTFGLNEFTGKLGQLRIVQWHAGQDTIDSRAWLATLAAPHRELDFARTGHYYDTGRDEFLRRLAASLPWILGHDRTTAATAGGSP